MKQYLMDKIQDKIREDWKSSKNTEYIINVLTNPKFFGLDYDHFPDEICLNLRENLDISKHLNNPVQIRKKLWTSRYFKYVSLAMRLRKFGYRTPPDRNNKIVSNGFNQQYKMNNYALKSGYFKTIFMRDCVALVGTSMKAFGVKNSSLAPMIINDVRFRAMDTNFTFVEISNNELHIHYDFAPQPRQKADGRLKPNRFEKTDGVSTMMKILKMTKCVGTLVNKPMTKTIVIMFQPDPEKVLTVNENMVENKDQTNKPTVVMAQQIINHRSKEIADRMNEIHETQTNLEKELTELKKEQSEIFNKLDILSKASKILENV